LDRLSLREAIWLLEYQLSKGLMLSLFRDLVLEEQTVPQKISKAVPINYLQDPTSAPSQLKMPVALSFKKI